MIHANMSSGDASAMETADGKYKTRRARVKRPCSTFSSVCYNNNKHTSNSIGMVKLHVIHTLLVVVHLLHLLFPLEDISLEHHQF